MTSRKTTRLDAIILSIFTIALGLFFVVESVLVVIGKIEVINGGTGQPAPWILGKIFGIIGFVWGVAILCGVIAEIRSDTPWAQDDSDNSGDITDRERGIEFDGFDFDDGS